jgi:hypothetical protein
MAWSVEGTDEFQAWFASLTSAERVAVARKVDLLEQIGPSLGRPDVDTLKGSTFANLKELRVQHAGSPFAFDPRRNAILLLGGRKTDAKWYKTAIPAAEKIYRRYLEEIEKEGLT